MRQVGHPAASICSRSPVTTKRGLPVFTSVAALQEWNAEARPVPVEVARAARAALDDGAEALLVDPSPRPRFVVTGERLEMLAAGWPT